MTIKKSVLGGPGRSFRFFIRVLARAAPTISVSSGHTHTGTRGGHAHCVCHDIVQFNPCAEHPKYDSPFRDVCQAIL